MRLRLLYHGHCFDGVASAAVFTRFYLAHFRADTSGKKFWDAASKSCTEFIARVASERFGFEDATLGPLISWAHTIDGAFYESAAQPVELREPALQLMQVIENVPEDDFIERVIRELVARPLDEVATSEEVQRRFRPLLARHLETVEAIRRKAHYERGVVNFDLVEIGRAHV